MEKKQSLGQDGWGQQMVFKEESRMRKVGLDGPRLQSVNFSFNWKELRMLNLFGKY